MSKRSKRRQRFWESSTPQKPVVQDHVDDEQYGPVLSFYKNHYKMLLIIPLVLVILAFLQIGFQLATTGDFVQKGISLKGGITVTVTSPLEGSLQEIRQLLVTEFPNHEINVRELTEAGHRAGIIVETDLQRPEDRDRLESLITGLYPVPPSRSAVTVESTGSSLGESFYRQTITAIIVAFIFMSIMVYLAFRAPVPSFLIIFAAFCDMIVTLAVFNVLGLKLSTAGIAAFLMLIGYSVDTDILLTSRVLKGTQGSIFARIVSAVKTGTVISISALVAIGAAMLMTSSSVIKEIMIIVFIGLVLDFIFTWIQNAGLLRWYLERADQ